MNKMNYSNPECKQVHDIWIELGTGRPLTRREETLIESHLEDCEACRLEAEALDMIRFDGSAGPAPDLDDITRRRRIDSILADADSHAQKKAARSVVSVNPFRKRIYTGMAAAMAAAAVALIAFAWISLESPGQNTGAVTAQKQPDVSLPAGRTVLLSGPVRISGGTAEAENAITEGTNIATGKGKTVIDLGTGITLLVMEQSRISIGSMDSENIDVRLHKGRIFGQVDPARRGPEFSVSTSRGKVRVVGTVFSVFNDDDKVRVSVFRGKVSIDSDSRKPEKVGIGQCVVIGRREREALSEEEKSKASSILDTLEILTASNSSVLTIESMPSGADVKLDGALIGSTPLMASVRPGHRMLELYRDDARSVREYLELAPDSTLSRTFDMSGMIQPGNSAPQSAAAQSAAAQSAVEKSPSPERKHPAADKESIRPVDLLAKAQTMRATRKWAEAVEAYHELIWRFPDSAEARSTLVSLGTIQLEQMEAPLRALEYFDEYLSKVGSGSLAQEAAFGRIMSLRKLGETGRELESIQNFIRDFPSAIQIPRLKERLKELQ